ncbi:MAG: hypothetical protein EBZ48_09890, partial [Proteobacteria bacterium]|nr:hypothetical protein [Pseudomonadota bacterium]
LTAALVFIVQVRPYLALEGQLATQSFDESALYSARPTSFITPARGGNSLWYGPAPLDARFGDAERAFFPGFIISHGCIIFLVLWLARRNRLYGTADSFAPGVDPALLRFLALLLVASLVLAMGPYLAPRPYLKLPFSFFTWFVPGLERVRAPGRFGMFAGLPAVFFTIFFLRTVFHRYRIHTITAIVGVFLVIEVQPSYKTFPFKSQGEDLYREVAQVIPADAALVEIPTAGGDAGETIVRVTDQLLGTLVHRGKIVLGYGTKNSPEADELARLDLRIQRGTAEFAELLSFCERLHIPYLLVHTDRYRPARRRAWSEFLRQHPELVVVRQRGETILLHRTVRVDE